MQISLSIAQLFSDVFGYNSTAFEPNFNDVIGSREKDLNRREEGNNGAPYYALDANGREYYLPVTLSYTEFTATGVGDDTVAEVKKVVLPYPVISIRSRKTIIETPLTERRGSVKEVINMQDYEIMIRGFIINKTNEYPEDGVKKIQQLYEYDGPVHIQNAVTDIFLLNTKRGGSDEVIVTDLSFPEYAGVKNVKPYQMTLLSDAPFNLIDLS